MAHADPSNVYGLGPSKSTARIPRNPYDSQLSQAVNKALGRTDHLGDPNEDILSRAAGLNMQNRGSKLNSLYPKSEAGRS